MSQSSKSSTSSSATPKRKERIIPIKIEGDESKVVSSTTPKSRTPLKLSTNKQENQNVPKMSTDNDVTNISDDSDSGNESNVCASIKSLSLSAEKPKNNVTDEGASDDTIIDIPQRTLPGYNVPEKIILVLDRAVDDNCTDFEIVSGRKYSPLFMLQHAIKIFLHNKSCIDNRHEFALIFLNENSATWVHDFTNYPLDIIHTVQGVTECEPEDIFDLNTVFDLLNKKIQLEEEKSDPLIPPVSVVRVVLLYGRSYSIPQLTKTNEIENLLNSPYFTVDVVMTHEPPNSGNNCNKIFKVLQEIDTKGFAYSFSVSRNASELHLAMGKILSHPLQRPHQLAAKYNVNSFK